MLQNVAAAALVVALSTTATAQVAILQIQVIEGEGETHAPGSRSPRPLTVEVTDETGRPVRTAAVSFHLPEEGPSGLFANGLRTTVVPTDERGRASARGLRWNRVAGRLQIRIVASKEQARAGIVSFQFISGTETAVAGAASPQERREPAPKVSRHRALWIALAAIAGGGAAAGVLAGRGGTAGQSSTASAVINPVVSVGPPTVTVGKP